MIVVVIVLCVLRFENDIQHVCIYRSDGGFLSHVPTDKSVKPLTYADEDQPQYESTSHNEPYMVSTHT